MFERRLKILLGLLCVMCLALAARAMQVQWIQHAEWIKKSQPLLSQRDYAETTRGSIRDRKGQLLAYDAPCIDAAVDYRAILEEPDPAWLAIEAKRLHLPQAQLRDNISDMWAELARVSGQSPDQMDELRQGIVQHVQMLERSAWWNNYQAALRRTTGKQMQSWYTNLLGGDQDIVDRYQVKLKAEIEPQVILPNVDVPTQADLARQEEKFFCLTLMPGKHRIYPYGRSACHLLGRVSQVGPEDMDQNDPNNSDELRRYWQTDLIGRGGIEGLCEQTLRGSRGETEVVTGPDASQNSVAPIPGRDVHMTIDIDLESDIEEAFARSRTYTSASDGTSVTRADQHGAAVVFDVATGQVLAMVSNPGFDPNTLNADYDQLSRDDLDTPLLNRATQMPLVPGSIVKPIVGAGAITSGLMTPRSTIQCQGFLVINGKKMPFGHCWTYALWKLNKDKLGPNSYPSHNDMPPGQTELLPNDMLTITDGLQRSCDVVFETIADRMGVNNLHDWYDRFGLGRKTGIGIEEYAGLIPQRVEGTDHPMLRPVTWFAGIGQGYVHATPLQMANVAATLARDGVWIRPQLVAPNEIGRSTTQPAADLGPDRVDLHLSPEALQAVRDGMVAVCNTRAGTGLGILPENQNPPLANDPLSNIRIAGKTGTAQTGLMTIPKRDAHKNLDLLNGRVQWIPVPVGSPGTQTWYVGSGPQHQTMDHAWFMGYAPADHPQVAFCVMVQYGSSGGAVAGSIAHDVLEACVRHGYLSVSP